MNFPRTYYFLNIGLYNKKKKIHHKVLRAIYIGLPLAKINQFIVISA